MDDDDDIFVPTVVGMLPTRPPAPRTRTTVGPLPTRPPAPVRSRARTVVGRCPMRLVGGELPTEWGLPEITLRAVFMPPALPDFDFDFDDLPQVDLEG